jgi:hypothetical protein
MPVTVPTWNPARLPMLFMSSDAGIVVIAEPMT